MSFFDDTRSTPTGARAVTGPRFSFGRPRSADLFDAWTFAEADATMALAAWWSAPPSDKRDAHVAYIAALDREAQAAKAFEHGLNWTR